MRNLLWQWIMHLTFIEVVPVHDEREHYLGDECWCGVKKEYLEGGMPDLMIVHNQYDGVQ